MEFTTETVEVEEICDDQIPSKKIRKVVVTDWKNDTDYKNWVEKTKKDDEIAATFTYTTTESAGTVEMESVPKPQFIEVKTAKKPTPPNSATVKNNRAAKRQIKVLDPNLPAFVCTEHNENISLDCRYCRIASGHKKKTSQKIVQNSEISSSGKVTVAIPKPNPTTMQAKVSGDGIIVEGTIETVNESVTEVSTFLQKNVPPGKYVQKFRSEWLTLPEFKDWLIEAKLAEDTDISCAKCKFCGTLLVNNSNNLVRHAISKKHMKNMEIDTPEFMLDQVNIMAGKSSGRPEEKDCKEDIFGRYIASELKRIKNKKTYEEVKWKILQALQSAAEKETSDDTGAGVA